MPADNDYIAYLLELFEQVGGVSAKRMFGGHGLFRDGLMIGLVADEVLYLKVDAETEPLFIEQGLSPFEFQRGDKVVAMSYRQAPEEALDNSEAMNPWAQRAVGAATRAHARKKNKR